MKWLLFCIAESLLVLGLASAQAPNVAQILSNRSIFGKDFSSALATVPAWNSVEELQVSIFAHQVVGASSYNTKAEAEKRVLQLETLLKTLKPVFSPDLRGLAQVPQTPLRPEAIPFPEDDSFRAALVGPDREFLNPQLTPSLLREALGPPEKIVYVTIQNKFERRPIVLTVYQYVGGQISFAEAVPSARPGFIDRAILDVRRVNAAAFQEAR